MTLTLHTLKPAKGARTASFRVGRGNASGRGTTAGRGTKGQRARTGGRNRLKLKGLKQMLLAFPKQRGFTSRFSKPETVKIGQLSTHFQAGAIVNVKSLKKAELVSSTATRAKIVAGGSIDKAIIVEVPVSESVAKLVTDAGGKLKTA